MNTIITIGRQYGSGGKEIGTKLAQYYNIPFYDKELLKVAEIEENKEKTPEELEYDDKFHKCLIKKLKEVGIPCGNHRARQMMRRDYEEFDYIIGMDAWNIRNIMRIIGSDPEKKVSMLLDFTDRPGTEIADPWYTGNFDASYDDVLEGCTGLLEHLKNISWEMTPPL